MNETSEKQAAILITGASSGLGAEYARQLAASDDRAILLVARRVERLEQLKAELGENAHVFPADLRSAESRKALVSSVQEGGFQIEMLINNAGFGSLGPFVESDQQWEQDMVEVNCTAPVHLTHAFLQDLARCGRGVVINLCSTAAFQAMPYMATYGATKAFLLSFTTALAAECRGSIFFLAQCPGPTRTEFHLVVGLPEKLDFLPAMSAKEVVAQALERAKTRRSTIVVNGWANCCLAQLNRLISRQRAAWLVAKILKRVRS